MAGITAGVLREAESRACATRETVPLTTQSTDYTITYKKYYFFLTLHNDTYRRWRRPVNSLTKINYNKLINKEEYEI